MTMAVAATRAAPDAAFSPCGRGRLRPFDGLDWVRAILVRIAPLTYSFYLRHLAALSSNSRGPGNARRHLRQKQSLGLGPRLLAATLMAGLFGCLPSSPAAAQTKLRVGKAQAQTFAFVPVD